MGALRKPEPDYAQPTEIIIFPIDRVRPDLVDRVSAWDKFADSPVGSLILFELKMLTITAVVFALLAVLVGTGYVAKTASGVDLFPDASFSAFEHLPQSAGIEAANPQRRY